MIERHFIQARCFISKHEERNFKINKKSHLTNPSKSEIGIVNKKHYLEILSQNETVSFSAASGETLLPKLNDLKLSKTK